MEDLSKPQIFIESTFGDSHPGSGHLDKLVEAARQGVAEAGGPIALVEEGNLIQLDVKERILAIVGVKGERKTPEEIDAILAERRKHWKPKPVNTPPAVLHAGRISHERRISVLRLNTC